MRRSTVDIIFLDIDGVLWTVPNEYRKRQFTPAQKRKLCYTHKKDRYFLDPIACAALNHLLKIVPDARIVISSTWRKGHTHKQMEHILIKSGVSLAKGRVIGSTPGSKSGFRGGEVNAWQQIGLPRWRGERLATPPEGEEEAHYQEVRDLRRRFRLLQVATQALGAHGRLQRAHHPGRRPGSLHPG
jgi:hypothetical protein